MQNIPPELIITVKSYINITSFKMKGSPDLGQAVNASYLKVQCCEFIEYSQTAFCLKLYIDDFDFIQ